MGIYPLTPYFLNIISNNNCSLLNPQKEQITCRTHPTGLTRWKLISQLLEESQMQEARVSDDHQHPWKMSSLVHQVVAPGQSLRHSRPVPPRICCFQTGMTSRWSSGSSEINKNNIFQIGTSSDSAHDSQWLITG